MLAKLPQSKVVERLVMQMLDSELVQDRGTHRPCSHDFPAEMQAGFANRGLEGNRNVNGSSSPAKVHLNKTKLTHIPVQFHSQELENDTYQLSMTVEYNRR